jgi:Gnt-I system high-affinity gluconate transporter
MAIVYIAIGVVILLLLNVVFKLNAFISLVISALAVGLMEGMSPIETMTSIKNGLGGTLGSLAMVIGFGAMLGKLMSDSGGAQQIAHTLVHSFGKKRVQLAAVLTAFIVGIALFFETGVVVLVPLVFTIAAEAGVPILYIGIPVISALITIHGFVPPHPGPTAVAGILHANIGLTLLYGIIIAIPSVALGGPLFTKLFKKESLEVDIPKGLFTPTHYKEEELPSFGISIFTAFFPVLLIIIQAVTQIFFPKSSIIPFVDFIGDPAFALLIGVIIAIFTFGLKRGKTMTEVMKSVTDSISGVAMILLIIGGGGAFKQVLIDSHVDKYIAHLMEGSTLSPLLLAWLIAAILRVVLGSATVAGLTAAGIVAPLVGVDHVNAELLALAVGAGSMTFSHVNDAGFWIYKEYFNLSIGKTIKTWSVSVTISSLVGLIGVLILNMIIG